MCGFVMSINRGKKFESVIRSSFEKVSNVSVDRLHDQTTGYKGSQNICDFIIYKKPYEYYIECKSVRGNLLPFDNITDTQWAGLLEKSKIRGVFAGIICWWVDRDVTRYIPITTLAHLKQLEYKSIRYDGDYYHIELCGRKKRVFFDYDAEEFLNEIQRSAE